MTELFEEINLSYYFGFKDLKATHFINYYGSISYWLNYYLFCILSGVLGTTIAFIWEIIDSDSSDEVFYFFLLMWLVFFLYLLYPVLKLTDLKVKYVTSKTPFYYAWELESKMLKIDQNYKQYKLDWSSITSVKEFKNYFQFRFGFDEKHYIPKRLLEEKDIETLRTNLYSCIDHNRLKLKKPEKGAEP